MQKVAPPTYNAPAGCPAVVGKGIGDVNRTSTVVGAALCAMLLSACTPTVKVEAPSEPITINLNIKLDADVRVKLEDQAREDISANPDIF